MQLLFQTTWQGDSAEVDIAQQRASDLIELFQECAGGIPISCPYDFSFTQAGFVPNTSTDLTPSDEATWALVSAWSNNVCLQGSTGFTWRICRIHWTFSSPVVLTQAQFTYNLGKGSPAPVGFTNYIDLAKTGGGDITQQVASDTDSDGSAKVLSTGTFPPTSIDSVELSVTAGYFNPDPGGFADITDFSMQVDDRSSCP